MDEPELVASTGSPCDRPGRLGASARGPGHPTGLPPPGRKDDRVAPVPRRPPEEPDTQQWLGASRQLRGIADGLTNAWMVPARTTAAGCGKRRHQPNPRYQATTDSQSAFGEYPQAKALRFLTRQRPGR